MPGFLDFTAGDVLTAANMDTLAQQVVVSVANLAAAPGTVHEGMTIYTQDTNTYWSYNGGWVRLPLPTSSSGRLGCFVRRTNDQSIANASETAISWDTDNHSAINDGYITVHATTGTTVTIPAGYGGLYSISGRAIFATAPAALGGKVILEAGGERFVNPIPAGAQNEPYAFPAPTMALSAGDTIQARVLQTSGGALNITNAKLWVYRLSV